MLGPDEDDGDRVRRRRLLLADLVLQPCLQVGWQPQDLKRILQLRLGSRQHPGEVLQGVGRAKVVEYSCKSLRHRPPPQIV